MARAPYQVLVMPFRRARAGQPEFACLRRSDDGIWQGIAGGGDPSEAVAAAARRETIEEAGVPADVPLYPLQTICSIPVCHFAARAGWPADLWVIPEYAFAIDCTGVTVRLSDEHTQLRWGHYEVIRALLGWDSNRTALWEIHERLRHGGFA